MMDKKKMVYVGIGVFFLLVLLNSSKNVQLKEVEEQQPDDTFDHSVLPMDLQPPAKLNENDPLPQTAPPKNLSLTGMSLMPRFDL